MEKRSRGGLTPLSSIGLWGAVALVLAGAGYFLGGYLAGQVNGVVPVLAGDGPAPTPDEVAWLSSGGTVEGNLGAEETQYWQFEAQAGQAATIEMWFHPGGGSNVDAEIMVEMIAPDGSVVAVESGSVFLPPYLVASRLPVNGIYSVRVSPSAGAPGRYSFSLVLSEAVAPVMPGVAGGGDPVAEAATPIAASLGQFMWPAARREISGWTFHDPRNPSHIGLDIAAAMWDPIVTTADGIVVFAGWGGGYGNLVIVQHPDNWISYYAHLEEIVVDVGDDVLQGTVLGGAGTTGYSTGPHLHFELRYNDRPVDPQLYLQ